MPEPQHVSQRNILISKIPQADYATPTPAVVGNFKQLQVTDQNFTKVSPQESDNKDDAHGNDWPTETYLESWDTEAPHDLAVSSENIGRLLLLLFGSVTTTQPDATNMPALYRHVFAPQDPVVSRQLPVATIVEILGSAINRSQPSMLLSSLSMKGDGVKRIMASLQFKGSGRETLPSGLSVANAESLLEDDQHFFFNSQAAATIADAGTLANAIPYGAQKRFNSWDWGWNNNPLAEEGYRPGAGNFQNNADPTSGAVRSELLMGVTEGMASMVVRLLTQSDEHAALKARKKMDWKLVLTGGVIGTYMSTTYNHKLTVEYPKVTYTSVDLGQSNGLMTQALQMRPQYDKATNKKVIVTLDNTVGSYVA